MSTDLTPPAASSTTAPAGSSTTAPAGSKPTVPTRWQISIHLVDGKHAVPAQDWPTNYQIDDIFEFVSPDGVARVVFPADSLFADEPGLVVEGARDLKVKRFGTFDFRCWIKPRGKDLYVGWGPDSPQSGSQTQPGGGSGH